MKFLKMLLVSLVSLPFTHAIAQVASDETIPNEFRYDSSTGETLTVPNFKNAKLPDPCGKKIPEIFAFGKSLQQMVEANSACPSSTFVSVLYTDMAYTQRPSFPGATSCRVPETLTLKAKSECAGTSTNRTLEMIWKIEMTKVNGADVCNASTLIDGLVDPSNKLSKIKCNSKLYQYLNSQRSSIGETIRTKFQK